MAGRVRAKRDNTLPIPTWHFTCVLFVQACFLIGLSDLHKKRHKKLFNICLWPEEQRFYLTSVFRLHLPFNNAHQRATMNAIFPRIYKFVMGKRLVLDSRSCNYPGIFNMDAPVFVHILSSWKADLCLLKVNLCLSAVDWEKYQARKRICTVLSNLEWQWRSICATRKVGDVDFRAGSRPTKYKIYIYI